MFQTMTQCIKTGKPPSDEDIEKIPSYMFCKWLSGSGKMIDLAHTFNNYSKIPIRCQFLAAKHSFQGQVGFVKFPKKFKPDESKRIDIVMETLKLSHEKTIDYLNYISDDEFKMLETQYNLTKTRK